jgi:hypothetical protein
MGPGGDCRPAEMRRSARPRQADDNPRPLEFTWWDLIGAIILFICLGIAGAEYFAERPTTKLMPPAAVDHYEFCEQSHERFC